MKNLLEENREEFIMDKQARMKKLVEVLNQASKAGNYFPIKNTTNYMMNYRH